jgi:hypothetical protein
MTREPEFNALRTVQVPANGQDSVLFEFRLIEILLNLTGDTYLKVRLTNHTNTLLFAFRFVA